MSAHPYKVLITGATGFIGQHLLEDIKDDNITVRALTRKKDPVFRVKLPGLEVANGDLSDMESMRRAIEGVDVIVNLAAELRDKERFGPTNVQGIMNMAEAASQHGVKKIVHLSSVGVVGMQYSSSPVTVTEQTACDPKNDYERTKLDSEKILIERCRQSGIPLVILRPTNVFGDEHPRNALLNFLSRCKQEKKFLYTAGAMLNYVYVKDLTHAIAHFMRKPAGNATYNVGEAMSFGEFHRTCCEAMKVKEHSVQLPGFLINFMQSAGYFGIGKIKHALQVISNRVVYDDSKLISEVPYRFGVKKGIEQTVNYYLRTGKL